MLLQYQVFLAIAPITIVLLIFLSVLILRYRRTSPTAYPMFWICILLFGYIVFNSLEQVTTTPGATAFFAKATYLFINSLPVVWMIFALRYTGQDYHLSWLHLLLLFFLPAVSVILAFTNEYHWLLWKEVNYVPVGKLLTMRVVHGFWFKITATYSYLLLLAGAVLIFSKLIRIPKLYKRQAVWLLIGTLCPMIFNFIYIFKIIPGLVKDYTCFGFFFSAICFYIGIFRYRLLELLPIARTMIIEQMKDGIIIVNSESTIIDVNPQAQSVIGLNQNPIGQTFDVLSSGCPALFRSCRDIINREIPDTKCDSEKFQATLSRTDEAEAHFDVECIPMIQKGAVIGHLITLHDTTEQINLLQRIEQLARTDELTGLNNRRHFMEIYDREIERCNRYKKPLSLGILDIDYFKKINDAYGHPAGDKVLAQFGANLKASVRDVDITARLGGEEFVVLMPETGSKEAYSVFCRIRDFIEKQKIGISDLPLPSGEPYMHLTVSIGVASTNENEPTSARSLMDKADKALYRSKQEGRNRVTLWTP